MTLTEFSYYLRRALPFIILFALFFLIFFYAFKLFFLFLQIQKPKTVYSNPLFGKISKPIIKNTTAGTGISFKLDTIEGQPVTATDSAKVFFLPQATTRFGYREKAFLMAKTFGIDTEHANYSLKDKEITISDNIQKLSVDIINFNFRYQYFFDQDQHLFDNLAVPGTKESQDKAVDFLQSAGRYPDELAKGDINTIFFNYDPLTKTFKLLNNNVGANMAEVDFFRPSIDNFIVVSPRFPNSQNYVLMVFTPDGPRILRAQINFFEKSGDQVGTYPIKTGDTAYKELKSGKAIVISNPQRKTGVTIKKMFTAYFDPDSYQAYLQPIYVFIGEDSFVAFVPAVTGDYLTE